MDDEGPYDLLVIGGGINGAAIAREAALRGLATCIVEMQDWGWGTSAKSSKLAHGGLRYLEQFEIGLVHEALAERERFFQQAPHLVRPLRFLYPIYPDIAARRTVRVGLWLYDMLSRRKSVPKRGHLSRRQTLERAPLLRRDGLRGAATYFDGQVRHAERLVWEMVLDARHAGAKAYNRTRVEYLDFERAAGQTRVTGAVVTGPDGTQRRIRARATVNAAGCWVDDVLGPLGEGKPPKVRKTKGTHIVVPAFTEDAFLIRARDGRVVFVLPWEGRSIVGTTDTDYEGDAGDAVATPQDIEYLQQQARTYFPEAPLSDILFTYAGVRALVNEEGVTESNVTRRHILYDHAVRDGVQGLWSLQGGKLTTARALGEDAVDHVCTALGRPELARLRPTRNRSYPGAAPAWAEFRREAVAAATAQGLAGAVAENLVDTYGSRWGEVLACEPRATGRTVLARGHPEILAQVTYAVQEEDATHLADVMLRRTMAGLAADGAPEAAQAALEWMGDLLGWDAAQRASQWQDYQGEASHLAVPAARIERAATAP